MRGEKLLKALDIIETLTCNTAGFIAAVLTSSKYNYAPMRNFRPKEHNSLSIAIRKSAEEKRVRQRIYALISQLRDDGLIRKVGDAWRITSKGRIKSRRLKSDLANALPSRIYSKAPSHEFVIVTFDVPEKFKSKRNWLRTSLRNLGFAMLQRSVWVGKVVIPENFLEDLKDIGLFNCVEIFSVGKAGTIRRMF